MVRITAPRAGGASKHRIVSFFAPGLTPQRLPPSTVLASSGSSGM
jgi:hypothetical protein